MAITAVDSCCFTKADCTGYYEFGFSFITGQAKSLKNISSQKLSAASEEDIFADRISNHPQHSSSEVF